jgi:hypothetical protein
MASNGSLTITTTCSDNVTPGTNVTVGVTVTNTGDMCNNTFVILIFAHRADNDVLISSNSSGNLTLCPTQTSAEWTLTFTMPNSNYYVNFFAQRDPTFDYL